MADLNQAEAQSNATEAGSSAATVAPRRETRTEFVIVSAYGRGDWLAGECATRGWKSTLLDLTEVVAGVSQADGPRFQEVLTDAEGPFGFFLGDDVPEAFSEVMARQGDFLPSPEGFTVWLKSGPIHFSGPLAETHLTLLGFPAEAQKFLKEAQTAAIVKRSRGQEFKEMEFSSLWPVQLAHAFAGKSHLPSDRAVDSGVPAPLSAPFSLRRFSSAGAQACFARLRALGVTVREQASVIDLRLDEKGKLVDAIEVADEQGGAEQALAYIWCLSSAETKRLPAHVFAQLYPGGVLKPSWYWQRFSLELTAERGDEAFPAMTIAIDDLFLPWERANFQVVRRRLSPRSFDSWVKLPIRAAGDLEYLESTAREMEAFLANRMPQFAPRVTVLPTGAEPYPQPPVPIWAEEEISDLEMLNVKNFFFSSPENWASLDWLEMYRHQARLLPRLQQIKDAADAFARKEQAKAERAEKKRLEKEQKKNRKESRSVSGPSATTPDGQMKKNGEVGP